MTYGISVCIYRLRIFPGYIMYTASQNWISIEHTVCSSSASSTITRTATQSRRPGWQGAYKIDDSELDSRQSCESRARERTSLVLRRCGATWGKSQEENLFARSSEVCNIFFPFLPSRCGLTLSHRATGMVWIAPEMCDRIKETRSRTT